MKKGILIVGEGIDGSGKSSVLKAVAQILVEEGIDIVCLVEPTYESKWGKEIRSRADKGNLTPEDEMELFIKDRKWDIEHNILPALNDGNIIFMDRYFFSNAVYQSFSSDYTWQEILAMNREHDVFSPEPDMVVIFDLDINTAYNRRTHRENSENQLEKRERLEYVRNTYIEMASKDMIGNYEIIDASLPFNEVVNILRNKILDMIKNIDAHRVTVHS